MHDENSFYWRGLASVCTTSKFMSGFPAFLLGNFGESSESQKEQTAKCSQNVEINMINALVNLGPYALKLSNVAYD